MSKKKISLNHIKKLMFEFDLDSLVAFDILAPSDEYDSEAEMVWERVNELEPPTVDDVVEIIENVMTKNFGSTPKRNLYEELASEILGVSEKHLCPVCRKKFFRERASFDICKECGWEDDSLQGDELTYEGGANDLSVIESQMVYLMLNKEEFKAGTERILDQYRRDVIPYHDGKHYAEFRERTKELVTNLVELLYRDNDTQNFEELVERRVNEILNYE